jgi:F-type H+-transporting ATPase subunit b
MNETLNQLGGLLLGSVPTIFLFLLLVILYRFLVYGPLTRVLNERRERTEGAIEQANAATAAAAAKTQEYEAQLRAARSKIFQARQQKLELWNRERDRAVAEAHEAAQRQIQEAKLALQAQTTAARRTIEGSIDELASEILRTILPKSSSKPGATLETVR